MSLRASYTLLAPIYDLVVAGASARLRRHSLAQLPPAAERPLSVLIPGFGTGLDIPHLPPGHRYTGLDLTGAMLARARRRPCLAQLALVQGDAMALPFPAAAFDATVLHLILAVVPDPARCLAEAARVTRPGGAILVLDKFLRPGQRAPLRRLANPLVRRMATRLDVVFEEVLAAVPGLGLESDRPALAGGWFRHIGLRRA